MSKRASITERMRLPFERKFTRIIRRVLRESLGDILTTVDRDTTEMEIVSKVRREPMEKAYIELYREVGSYFADRTMTKLKRSGKVMELKETEWTDIWRQQLEAYVVNVAGSRITWVTETTRQLVWDSLQKIKENEGISATATSIQKSLSKRMIEIERWRAIRIAQTETLTASNRGAFVAAKSTGLPMNKMWFTGGRNVRDTHAALEGVTIPIDEPFNVGGTDAMAPGDANLPPEEAINCKCGVDYIPI